MLKEFKEISHFFHKIGSQKGVTGVHKLVVPWCSEARHKDSKLQRLEWLYYRLVKNSTSVMGLGFSDQSTLTTTDKAAIYQEAKDTV